MEYILTSYKLIKSKKNNKDYIVYCLLFNRRFVVENMEEYSEFLEEFCKNHLMENVNDNVIMNYYANIKAFKPCIKYN